MQILHHFIYRTWASVDFGISGGPETNPLGTPKDNCNRFSLYDLGVIFKALDRASEFVKLSKMKKLSWYLVKTICIPLPRVNTILKADYSLYLHRHSKFPGAKWRMQWSKVQNGANPFWFFWLSLSWGYSATAFPLKKVYQYKYVTITSQILPGIHFIF